MITKAASNKTPTTKHEEVSLGSVIKENLAEKLPIINTQVRL